MFFTKSKKNVPTLIEKSEEMDGSLSGDLSPELLKQLQIISLGEKDLQVAMCLKPIIEQNIETIIHQFYSNIERSETLVKIIEKHSSIDTLQQTLQLHIVEIFSGVIDREFIEKRKRIALRHLRIGLTQEWYIASFENLFQSMSAIIIDELPASEDRLEAIQVVNKLLNLEQQLVLKAFDDEFAKLKENEMNAKLDKMRSLQTTSDELAKLSQITANFHQKMSRQINTISSSIKSGTDAISSTLNVVYDGKAQLQTVDHSMEHMDQATNQIITDMSKLETLSEQVKDISEIVKSIAKQTNLLALNASIEAARAGDHGKGFAVVADEVRNLAEQSSISAENITDLIEKTNEQIKIGTISARDVETQLYEIRRQISETNDAFENIDQATNHSNGNFASIQMDIDEFSTVYDEMKQSSVIIDDAIKHIDEMVKSNE